MRLQMPLQRELLRLAICSTLGAGLLLTFANLSQAVGPTSLTSTTYSQTFDSSVGANNLPSGWGVSNNRNAPGGGVDNYSGSLGTVNANATSFNGSSTGQAYIFNNSGDGAVGFLNSNTFTSPQAVYFGFTNNSSGTITDLNLSWNYEKYRLGSRAWNWTFFSSTDGTNFSSVSSGDFSYGADSGNTTASFPPIVNAVSSFGISSLNLAIGASYYFEWKMTGVGGSSNGQALGVDDFSLTATIGGGGPTLLAGDVNQDGHVDSADVVAMMTAFTDVNAYHAQRIAASPTGVFTDSDLLFVLDANGDGAYNNGDVQGLLDKLLAGNGSVVGVPEPSTLVLGVLGGLGLAVWKRKKCTN